MANQSFIELPMDVILHFVSRKRSRIKLYQKSFSGFIVQSCFAHFQDFCNGRNEIKFQELAKQILQTQGCIFMRLLGAWFNGWRYCILQEIMQIKPLSMQLAVFVGLNLPIFVLIPFVACRNYLNPKTQTLTKHRVQTNLQNGISEKNNSIKISNCTREPET